MFQDQEEELQRLQKELLAQEEENEQTIDQLLGDPQLEELLKDTRPTMDTVVYQNFSNDYGSELRNYASGYKAYNTDKLDVDTEEFSRQVQKTGSHTGLLITAAALTVAVLVMVAYILIRYRGLW